MDSSAVEAIAELGRGEIETINGHEYYMHGGSCSLIPIPTSESMHVFSLRNLVNAIKAQREGAPKMLVNIINHEDVVVVGQEPNANKKINVYFTADTSKILTVFPFGQKMNQEEFIINVMTKFVNDAERIEILKLVSSVSDGETKTSNDDGVSQEVTTKSGVALVQQKLVKAIWNLKTYKTFPEINQPVIPYILRVYKGPSSPMFALHECDGGAWKIETVGAIRRYLMDELSNVVGVVVL